MVEVGESHFLVICQELCMLSTNGALQENKV